MKKFIALMAAALVAASVYAGEYADISIKDVKVAADAKKAVIIDANEAKAFVLVAKEPSNAASPLQPRGLPIVAQIIPATFAFHITLRAFSPSPPFPMEERVGERRRS